MNYTELRKEIKERFKTETLSKKQLILCEAQIYKDLLAENPKCAKCNRTEKLTLDHIISKRILADFGVDTETEIIEGNYQILCRLCNQFKSGKLDFSLPITKELLLKLLAKL